jgi:hypothetical protein
MDRARLAGASAAALLVALSGAAHAQLAEQVYANASGGATSNALSAPDNMPALIQPDEFTAVRAGLQATYIGRRSDQTLAYAYAGTFYATYQGGDMQNHDLGWRFHTAPTGTTDLRVVADASYSHLSAMNPLAASSAVTPPNPSMMTTGAMPAGAASFVGLSAGTIGSYQPNGRYTWGEYTTLSEILPVGDSTLARSFSVAQNLHFDRNWGVNAFTTDLLLSFLDASAVTAPATATTPATSKPANEAGGAQIIAGWKRDYSAHLQGMAGAGALFTKSFSGSGFTVVPAAQATVHYQRGIALAQASLAQGAQSNQLLGQYLVTDVLSAGLYLSLDKLERFHVAGFGSAQHASLISNGSLSTAADLLVADVGLSYRPLQWSFVVSLYYNYQDQIGYTVNGVGTPSLHRQLVLLTVTGVWKSDTGLR